jgi:hypothetical protein
MIMFPGFAFEAFQHLKHFKGEIHLAANKMNDNNKRIKMTVFNNYAMRIDIDCQNIFNWSAMTTDGLSLECDQ